MRGAGPTLVTMICLIGSLVSRANATLTPSDFERFDACGESDECDDVTFRFAGKARSLPNEEGDEVAYKIAHVIRRKNAAPRPTAAHSAIVMFLSSRKNEQCRCSTELHRTPQNSTELH